MDRKEEIKNKIEFAEENIEFYKRKVKESEEEKSELETELEKIEQKESQEWVPNYNDDYWFVNKNTMRLDNNIWHDTEDDNTRLENKVIFKTENETIEYLRYLKAKEKAMNEFSKEEWEDRNINKYYIQYDYEGKKFKIEYNFRVRKINTLFFRTEKSTQEFINKYEKFLRKELGV